MSHRVLDAALIARAGEKVGSWSSRARVITPPNVSPASFREPSAIQA
jgi:hypothetical protein